MRLFFYGILFTLILAVAGVSALVTSGAIPVAAARDEAPFIDWFLHTVFERRVASEAVSITPPANLGDQEVTQEGARGFAGMCTGCHTPPGKEPSVVSRGLNPSPPDLVDISEQHSSAELFWVVSNGVRMTGMPAFGPTHSEEQIWALVSFLQFAGSLDEAGYREYVQTARAAGDGMSEGDGHHHRHFDEHPPAVNGEQDGHSSPQKRPGEEPQEELAPVEGTPSHNHGGHDHGDHEH